MRRGEIQQYSTPLEIVSNPSNDFIGQFVLQKNILPIQYIKHSYFTVLGKLNISLDKLISQDSVCMFDKNSIIIEHDKNGLFKVIAREYRINHYVYTVIINDLKLCVEMNLETTFTIGEKCRVRSILDKEFLVLPEKIKSYF